MKIRDFKPFVGKNCELTTIGSLLYQEGIEFSEPMLFGLGEGLGYIFWRMKAMDYPFIGGRVKPDKLAENICRNLNLKLQTQETSSLKKAWSNVENRISNGQAVGLKLDCFHLDYFNTKIHFAAHYVAMYGYDENYAYLIDTEQQGCEVKTTRRSLELARSEKGPMSSRNRSFTIEKDGQIPKINEEILKQAIFNNTTEYLNPPIKNISYKGIEKTASEIKKWFQSSDNIKYEFQTVSMLMERAGTGGALFRNLYRDFLKESVELTNNQELKSAYIEFSEIAKLWTEISNHFHTVGETNDYKHVESASNIFMELSNREKKVMEKLNKACA